MSDPRRIAGRPGIPAPPRGAAGVLAWLTDGFQWLRGTPGHVLTVQADLSLRFAPPAAGAGGGVTSVNGDTGPAVTLTAADVSAVPAADLHPTVYALRSLRVFR